MKRFQRAMILSGIALLVNACPPPARADSGWLIRNFEVQVEIHPDAVVIEDTGVGLPAARVHDLEQPFVRGSAAGSGYGVGLTIVRRLSDRFGWPVEFTSQAGVGTRVRVTFHGATATPLAG